MSNVRQQEYARLRGTRLRGHLTPRLPVASMRRYLAKYKDSTSFVRQRRAKVHESVSHRYRLPSSLSMLITVSFAKCPRALKILTDDSPSMPENSTVAHHGFASSLSSKLESLRLRAQEASTSVRASCS